MGNLVRIRSHFCHGGGVIGEDGHLLRGTITNLKWESSPSRILIGYIWYQILVMNAVEMA